MPRSRTPAAAADFLVAVAEPRSFLPRRFWCQKLFCSYSILFQVTDILRRQQVESLPFGGLHLLICGDFYQLRCVSGVPLYNKSHALTSDNSKVCLSS